MANDYSGTALVIALIAIFFIIIIIAGFAFAFENPQDVRNQLRLNIITGDTNKTTDAIAPQNLDIYVNTPTNSMTLTINKPNTVNQGSVFYVSNLNKESISTLTTPIITVVPGANVTFTNTSSTTTPTSQYVIPGSNTSQFLWRTNNEVYLMELTG